MSLIFTGDIALPFVDSISLLNLPKGLASEKWIVNLEGSLVEPSPHFIKEKRVFNDIEAVKRLCDTINIKIASFFI